MDEFDAHALHDLLKLRVDVFVVEQECPYPEIDGRDPDALHLRLLHGEELLACARLFAPAAPGAHARIGRIAVSPAHRGHRLGEAVTREAVAACEARFPECCIALSAQSHLVDFYEGFGFMIASQEYLEDGIPHVEMLRPGLRVPETTGP